MSTPNFGFLEGATSLDEIQGALSQLKRVLDFYFQGKISSSNIREISGWQVSEDSLTSEDGDVGFSTLDTPVNDLRIWAGSSNRDNAPFRVYENGRVDANDLHLHGGSLTIGSSFSVTNAGILSAAGANISGNITMTSGSISWNNVNSDPVAVNASSTANMAVSIAHSIVEGTYSGGTFIDERNVMSPNIYAGYIYGSTIQGGQILSNTTISVNTDATIGRYLTLSESSFSAGIRWGTSSYASIFGEPSTRSIIMSSNGGMTISANGAEPYNAIFISCPNGVFINGMNVVSQINALWAAIGSLG